MRSFIRGVRLRWHHSWNPLKKYRWNPQGIAENGNLSEIWGSTLLTTLNIRGVKRMLMDDDEKHNFQANMERHLFDWDAEMWYNSTHFLSTPLSFMMPTPPFSQCRSPTPFHPNYQAEGWSEYTSAVMSNPFDRKVGGKMMWCSKNSVVAVLLAREAHMMAGRKFLVIILSSTIALSFESKTTDAAIMSEIFILPNVIF